MSNVVVITLNDINAPDDLRLKLEELKVMAEMCDWKWLMWRYPGDVQEGKVIFKVNIETKTRQHRFDFHKSRAIIPKHNVDKIIEIVDCKFWDRDKKEWNRLFIEEGFDLCFKRIKETLLEGE